MLKKRVFITFISFLLCFAFMMPVYAVEGKININTATVEELSEGLTKVGPKYAAAIVEYRQEHGDFETPEEIKNVKGIGDKTFEANQDIIVVKD